MTRRKLHALASAVCLVALSVAVHEIGHALAVSAFGVRIRIVRLGHGRIVRVFRVFNRRVEVREKLRLGEWSGGVYWKARSRGATWLAYGMIALAGPIASALWAALLCVAAWWIPALIPAAIFALGLLRPRCLRADADMVMRAWPHVVDSIDLTEVAEALAWAEETSR